MSRSHLSPLAQGTAVVSRPFVISRESWGSVQISEHAEIILASHSARARLGQSWWSSAVLRALLSLASHSLPGGPSLGAQLPPTVCSSPPSLSSSLPVCPSPSLGASGGIRERETPTSSPSWSVHINLSGSPGLIPGLVAGQGGAVVAKGQCEYGWQEPALELQTPSL